MKGNERLSYAEWRDRCRDRSDPLNHGLVFSLPMFEGSGSASVIDASRLHHPVTQVHAPVWTQLASGIYVLDFDGSNDYLAIPGASSPGLNFTTQDFSACAWVNKDDTNTRYVISRGVPGTRGWDMYGITGSATVVRLNNGYTITSGSGPTPGTWGLMGFSRVGASVRVYFNGSDSTSSAGSHPDAVTSPTDEHRIGCRSDSATTLFGGLMWNPRIWARSLSAAEHRMMFERERGLFGV